MRLMLILGGVLIAAAILAVAGTYAAQALLELALPQHFM